MKDNIWCCLKSILTFILFFFCYALLSTIASTFSLSPQIEPYIGNVIQLLLSVSLIILFAKKIKINNISKANFKKYIFLFLIALLFTNIINSILKGILGFLPKNEIIAREFIKNRPINGILSSVIFAPIYEEIITRLNFKESIKNKWLFIIFTSFIFASLHLLSANTLVEYMYIIPYALMGMIFGYIYYDSNSIITSISFHALNNLIQVILIFGGLL